ncbi:MAG: DUF3822 family protein [Prevotella sp.]|nr:DUF3822 family protein [Prevotella sp.]
MSYQRLIIRVTHNSLSFSTLVGGQVEYERYPLKNSISIAANMREALQTVNMLQRQYERVVVLVDSPMMMIPTEMFNEDEVEMLYRYTFTGQNQMAVFHSVVPELNVVAVFSLSKDLRTVLTDRFEQSLRMEPATSAIWLHMYQKSFTGPRQKLYGYFHDRSLEVFAFAQGRFKFYNSYAVSSNPNDALFYLLSVWKQLGMAPSEDEMHLSGDIPGREQLTDEARRFIKRVFITNPSGEFNRAPVTQIEGMPYDLMVYYLKR